MGLFKSHRFSPIGIDLGSRTLKLTQVGFESGRPRIQAIGQQMIPLSIESPDERRSAVREALINIVNTSRFSGRDCVLALNPQQLFIQNVRLPRLPEDEMLKVVRWEAEERLPDDFGEAEVRHLVAGDVRSTPGAPDGSEVRREVILMACRRKELHEIVDLLEDLRLQPIAVDVPACAVARTAQLFLRRKVDEQNSYLIIDMGAGMSTAVVTRGQEILLIKPLPIGGTSMDKLVARKLKLRIEDAASARRQWSDSNDMDPNLARAVSDAVRAEVEALAGEILMCVRYHSVTFRGNRIAKAIIMGGEGTSKFAEQLAARIDMPCELGDPFTGVDLSADVAELIKGTRPAQWAVPIGLCLRDESSFAA